MKKIYFKMMALIASAMMCLGVYAQDAIEPTIISPSIELGEAFTSVEALKDARFAITADGKALYGTDNQNAAYNDFAQAFKSSNSGYQWRLLEVNADSSFYQLQLVTPAGQDYAIWGNPVGVLNSQATTGWCSFILGSNADIANGSTYEILYVEGQGFTIKNVGTGLYQGADAAPANKETPTYFTFTTVSSTYVPALEAMLAEGEEWKAIIADAEAVAAYDAAIAGIDPAATEDALADAKKVDAAISELAKAQTVAGASFTRAIVNPSFELGDRTGWEENYGGNTSGTNNFGKKTGAIFLERWTAAPGTLSDGYIQQTVAGLPNGTYKLTAEMQNLVQANDPATDGKGYYLVANGDSTEAAVAGETVEVTTEVTDGTLTIAAAIKGCTGNWVCVDNFQLTLVEPAPVFYSISVAEIVNGTVTADPEEAIEGAEVVLAVTPADGYELESLSVVAGETAIEVSESYVFVMPAADVTVNATFAPIKIEPTIISPSIELGEAFTSVEALKDARFAITADGKALYGTDNQNAAYNDFAQAFKSSNSGYQWRLLEVNADSSFYQLQLVTPAGQDYAIWGNPVGVLNSQATTGWCSFILGSNADIANGSTYEILYVEGQGFTIKNVGTGLYQGADAAPANKETPTYFTFTTVSSTYVPALEAMLAEGEEWKAIIADAEAVAAYDAAIAGIDPAATEDALADAKKVDAAISELAKAQTVAGASFTRAIVNPSFELGDRTGWEENYGGNTSGTNNFGKKTGAIFLERWTAAPGTLSDGYIQQTVAGLPNGTYKLTAEMQNLVQANDPATDGKGYYLVANGDSTEAAVAGETVEVTTEVTDGTLTIAAAIKGCTGNWVCVDNFQLTFVEAAPEVSEATYTIDVERYPGMGYGVTTAPADLAEALAFLGVEAATAEMLSIVNPDGTEVADYATYDGWFAVDGTAKTWSALNAEEEAENKKGVCVKFFQALSNGQFEICDMNGADVVGTTYTVKYALKANDKTAIFAINVKFVEKPVLALTYADLTNKKDVAIELTSETGKSYEALTADVDVAAILAELGAESLNDVTVYAVQSDGTLDDNYKLGTTDGWRNAEGDWQSWGADARICVKADFALESAQIYYVGGMDGQTAEPATYTATYAFVNANAEAVTLKVTLSYIVPVGIDGVDVAAPADRKYIENGKIVIIKNGVKYNAAGQVIE